MGIPATMKRLTAHDVVAAPPPVPKSAYRFVDHESVWLDPIIAARLERLEPLTSEAPAPGWSPEMVAAVDVARTWIHCCRNEGCALPVSVHVLQGLSEWELLLP